MHLLERRPLAIALLASLALLFACRKTEQGGVQYAPVDISINVNNPAYADIQVPGGWLYLTGGSLGIIVYRRTIDEFVAMDRQCTYQPQSLCRVVVNDDQITATDTACCHSNFVITDGSVTQGPATIGLQRYNTTFNGTTLRIFN